MAKTTRKKPNTKVKDVYAEAIAAYKSDYREHFEIATLKNSSDYLIARLEIAFGEGWDACKRYFENL